MSDDTGAIAAEAAILRMRLTGWQSKYLRLVEALGAIAQTWREQAQLVNQPDSPSLLVQCAEDLEALVGHDMPPLAAKEPSRGNG